MGGEMIKDVRETGNCLLFLMWKKVEMCLCLKVSLTEDIVFTLFTAQEDTVDD